jgi:hypothetical protein
MPPIIEPTVGRNIYYYPPGHPAGAQPHLGLIALVHSVRSINLACFNENGTAYACQAVVLVQDGDPVPEQRGYACWMPFQKGQAAKAEAAENLLAKQVADLAGDMDAKFASLGGWLNPRIAELELKVKGQTTPPNETQPGPGST